MRRLLNQSNGNAVPSENFLPVLNPATLEPIAAAPVSTLEDLQAAVDAGRAAVRSRWSTDVALRRAALANCAGVLERHSAELSRLLSAEQGKPIAAAAGEIRVAVRICRHYANLVMPPQILRDGSEDTVSVLRMPIGVAGLIVPWNVPIGILFMKLGPALYAGNATVVKPAPTTPLTTLRLAELLNEVLPRGVLNTLTGDAALGEALVAHPGVAMVSFTGSTATGKRVMSTASSSLKRLTLELGGNDAAIVLDDADPALVAPRLFAGAFNNAGQLCVAVKRVFVHEQVYAQVVLRLHDLVRRHKVGIGSDPSTNMGPVNNAMQMERVRGLLADAKAQGGEIFTEGPSLPDLPGYFLRPAVVTGLPEDARLVVEEQFGPALPVLAFSDLDRVVEQVNTSEFGLGASVWSMHTERAVEVASRLEVGSLYVNSHAVPPDPEVPFGGVRSSGFGHELGEWGVDDFSIRRVMRVEKFQRAQS